MLVGFDGSAASRAALRTAGDEAARRGTGLCVVLVSPRTGTERRRAAAVDASDAHRTAAHVALEAALGAARTRHRRLLVDGCVVDGRAGPVLSALSGDADLLVVGRSRRRPTPGAVLSHLLRVGAAPVLTVAAPAHPRMRRQPSAVPLRATVLVGTGPGRDDGGVLDAALAEAVRRSASLSAVHAVGALAPDEAEVALELDPRVLVRARSAGVAPLCRTVRGAPADALVDASARADLLVVGHRRRRGWDPIGAVASGLLHRTGCPVLVVPLPAAPRGEASGHGPRAAAAAG